ncbi:Nitrilotriacetate monooxygenase component A/pristinamycin IIA synthase subunit A [Thozetella sp. PMI_491]|nr:Nitrilotriacetate monooxygenase component A/pristinamycin IIA synthase subunit A [Thozetella sp. PMI_491]
MSPGQWRDPTDKGTTKDTLEYWLNLARLAERGKISFIFFADSYATHEIYGGTPDAMIRAGAHFATIDPFTVIPAMAAVTKSLGFGVTASTSYLNPYTLARTFSSLDHLTNGRVAWNVVTSWSKSAAKALGYEDVVPHDERYAVADEYLDAMYQMWESGYAPDARVFDPETRVAFDPEKIKRIEFHGKYHNVSGVAPLHASPQRTPVLFQAGTSKAGRAFASKHAEAVYVGGLIPSQTKDSIAQIRADAAARGRDPASLKFFVGISPILGRTLEEAEAKYERARENASPIGGLAQFSGYTGIDLSRFPLDEPFELTDKPGDAATHTFLENFNKASGTNEKWTPRKLGEKMALGGFHPAPVGTAEMVADVFEQWVDEADVDGFNIAYITTPGSQEDIVDLLVPELQKRGLMWEDYAVPGGSLRENLTGVPGCKELPADHYGHKFKWGTGFEGDSVEAFRAAEAEKEKMDVETNGEKTNGANGSNGTNGTNGAKA